VCFVDFLPPRSRLDGYAQVRIMSDGGIDDPEALQAEFLRQRRAMAEARGKARAAEVAPAAEQGVAHEDST